jgi:hypothetical protein
MAIECFPFAAEAAAVLARRLRDAASDAFRLPRAHLAAQQEVIA